MAVIFLWLHDTTPQQARTRRISSLAQQLLLRALALTALPIPGLGRVIALLGDLIDEILAIGSEGEDAEVSAGRSS
jgi:hypothetical protein